MKCKICGGISKLDYMQDAFPRNDNTLVVSIRCTVCNFCDIMILKGENDNESETT